MQTTVDYNAPPTISRFMLDNSEVRLLIGPFGSGKTTGCLMELARRMMSEHPDARGVRRTRFSVIRNTAQQLRQTVLPEIQKWLQPAMNFKVTDSTIEFRYNHPTLGRIESDWLLIPLDRPEDTQRLLSLNITGAWISEFREVPLKIMEPLLGRVGRYRPLGLNVNAWYGIIAESNPPDEDSEWYTKMEIERPSNYSVYKQPGGMEPNAENKENLRKGYYESLMDGANPDWVDVHVHAKYGKSLSGEAVFRASFNSAIHITYEELNPLPGKPLMLGQDFGRTPATLVGQMDSKGRLNILRECTAIGSGIEQFCTMFLRPLMFEHYSGSSHFMIGDPSGRDKAQTTEESAFDILKRLGFKIYPAPTNLLEPRLRAVEQLFLRRDGILISGAHCPQLVKALKFEYRFKRKKNNQELDESPEKTHPWSDLADCLQYMALGTNGNYMSKMLGTNRVAKRAPLSAASWT